MRNFFSLVLAFVLLTSFSNTISAQCALNFNSTSSVNLAGFPDSLASGDFNLDGKLDLAVVSKNLSSVSILLNQGSRFVLGGSYDVGSNPSAIAAGDFNNDGKTDLAVANQSSNTFTLLYGNGIGGFDNGGSINTLPQPSSIFFADFNKDGGLDIALLHLNLNIITIISGDGTGGFLGTQAISHTQFRGGTTIAAADLNLDGRPDIVASGLLNSGGFDYETLIVSLGNSAGGFSTFNFVGVTGWVSKIADFKIADFNRDGKPDIITTISTIFQGDVRYTISRGNGTGAFPPANTTNDIYAFNGKTGSLATGDFNGDGKADFGLSQENTSASGNFYVLQGNGSGAFPAAASPFNTGGGNAQKLLAADFNGDGKTDLASTNSAENKVNITLNTCGGLKPDASKVDFDGDGKTDVAIFRPSLGQWWYLKSSTGGNGALEFGSATDRPVPGDYSGDGKTDIAFFRPSTGFWFILRSEDSSFYAFPFGANGDMPATGDYDGDGRTDAAVYRPSTSIWYISNSAGAPTTILQFGVSGDIPVGAD